MRNLKEPNILIPAEESLIRRREDEGEWLGKEV